MWSQSGTRSAVDQAAACGSHFPSPYFGPACFGFCGLGFGGVAFAACCRQIPLTRSDQGPEPGTVKQRTTSFALYSSSIKLAKHF